MTPRDRHPLVEMGSRTVVAAALVLVGCGGGVRDAPGPPVPGVGGNPFVAGYHTWWAGDAWASYPLAGLDRLYLFEVELSPNGTLGDLHGWPERWESLMDAARAVDLSVVPVVTLHPEESVETLLGDSSAVERAAASIATLVASHPGLDGVHLDLEVFRPLPAAARAGYVDLARAVRRRLDGLRPGAVLSVFLPALDLDDAYDEVALAQVADYVVVQGYDLHHRTGERAGPVAALEGWNPRSWEAVVDRLTGMGLAPGTLVMGVPLYGYRWPTEGPEPGSPTRGPGVTLPLRAPPDVLPDLPRAMDEVERYGLRRDPRSGSPYYTFRDENGWVQGWFEDGASLRAKRDFVLRRGLAGVAYFPLAYAPPELGEELERRGAGRGGRD